MTSHDTTKTIEIGTGRLTWSRHERISDRYGTVMLMLDGDSLNEPSGYVRLDRSQVGRTGTLTAEVLATRESTHIGDLFRGLTPETPDVGELIVLGAGDLFIGREDFGADVAGLLPDDGRSTDWLDPRQLYRAHEQTVRLTFTPVEGDDQG